MDMGEGVRKSFLEKGPAYAKGPKWGSIGCEKIRNRMIQMIMVYPEKWVWKGQTVESPECQIGEFFGELRCLTLSCFVLFVFFCPRCKYQPHLFPKLCLHCWFFFFWVWISWGGLKWKSWKDFVFLKKWRLESYGRKFYISGMIRRSWIIQTSI